LGLGRAERSEGASIAQTDHGYDMTNASTTTKPISAVASMA